MNSVIFRKSTKKSPGKRSLSGSSFRNNATRTIYLAVLFIFGIHSAGFAVIVDAEVVDPELVIPTCPSPPTIDGKLGEGEWQYAATLKMLASYPTNVLRQEQPAFYVFRDKDNLYVCMDSVESSTNTVVARCSQPDNKRIIGDDCMELMLAPGAGEMLQDKDFPVYYFAVNSIGTIWDAKFKPLRAECHNSWQSGAVFASQTDGSRWTCEMKIPFASITSNTPVNGTTWRMNFDRTYFGYSWQAWNASGGLNNARVGGDVTFDSNAPAVRLMSADKVIDGKLNIVMQAANPTDKACEVEFSLHCTGEHQKGKGKELIGEDTKKLQLAPGEIKEITLGKGESLNWFNTVTLEVKEPGGRRLFFLERQVNLPVMRFAKKPAPELPMVYIFPRFLPSLERLAVIIDCTAWIKKNDYRGDDFSAEISAFKSSDQSTPVFSGELTEFKAGKGVWRHSTQDLAEGNYNVYVKVKASGKEIIKYDDWFEKRIFPWMKKKYGVGEDVPKPYTALQAKGREVSLWGRSYHFTASGLPERIVSQDRELLSGAAELEAVIDSNPVTLTPQKKFKFTKIKPTEVSGTAELTGDNLRVRIDNITEYDGFTLFKLNYGPGKGKVTLDRLRVKIPLNPDYIKFYSASGDTQGVNILGDVFPEKQGKVYDSSQDTRSVTGSPTFPSLYWVGDHETCLCYAADSDKGWAVRDDAPAVEAWRSEGSVDLYLNLVDRKITLTEPRALEFALQAGPLKPLPDNWRGIQDSGNPDDAVLTRVQLPGSGGGFTLYGGSNFIHPGLTPEMIKKSRDKVAQYTEPGKIVGVGYHRWPYVTKGLPEARVFRGEWGIDKYIWESTKKPRKHHWKKKYFGDNKDMYVILPTNTAPSYIDFISYAYDLALRETALTGFYDDTGYPVPVFDQELGLGYVRDDGRQISSSGLWVYRDRWKRAAYLNSKHDRPNFLSDSQHIHAHFMPAYGFIGCWVPCEKGYYNHFTDRDNLGFYGSVDRYAAINPARAFGQVPMVGMSSPQWEESKFDHDTRSMMLLTMLNDHNSTGKWFGNRNARTVCRLRHARNLFRPWEKDIKFIGYWESVGYVETGSDDLKVSLYSRPGSALFVIGNTGKETVTAKIRPDWRKLDIASGKIKAVNSETKEPVAVRKSAFDITVPSHDLKVVLAGDLSKFTLEKPGFLINQPPKLENVLNEYSDGFRQGTLSGKWQKTLAEGRTSVGFLYNMLYIQGDAYGYAAIREKLGIDNISAQCLILRERADGLTTDGGSLFLYWENGSYVQSTFAPRQGSFIYSINGKMRRGSKIKSGGPKEWYPYLANWVKIGLTPEKIEFCGSTDNQTWVKDLSIPRDNKFAGPPEYLILGNGRSGEAPYLENVAKKHNPQRSKTWFFSELIVGKE